MNAVWGIAERGALSLPLIRLLALAVALVLLALALRPEAHVYDMPLTEDGYYSLSVARNLAAGKGLTIDGINLTNGFQPLFTMIEAGAFVLAQGDEIVAMRLVMAFSWLFHILGAITVALIARDAWPAKFGASERYYRVWVAVFLYLAAPLMLNHAYNGLETGCVMFFYALCWRWMQTGRDESWDGIAIFGVLIGLMVLARIDAAFLALVLGLNELRRSWRLGVGTMLARAALMGGGALVVSSPWWLYNLVYFGSPMPTSGTAQQAWALEWLRIEFADWALRLVAVPWIFAGAKETAIDFWIDWPFGPAGRVQLTLTGFVRTAVLLIVALFALYWWRSGVFRRELASADSVQAARTRRTIEFAVCFLVALAALVVYYTASFVAYWFFYRYFAPAALFAFVIAPILWARIALSSREPGAQVFEVALAFVLAAHVIVLAIWAQSGKGLGGNTVYHDQVALVEEYVPDEDEVAAGQSGTLGFFRKRVVNTDGKVNRAALAYQDNMWDYLRERGVKWFVDWPHYVNKYLGVPLGPDEKPAEEANGWRLVAERNYFYLYEYVGPGADQPDQPRTNAASSNQ
jgi:hypothetical protein